MNYTTVLALFTFLAFCLACQPNSDPDPKEIITQAIEAQGGENYNDSHISFTFRDRDYDIYLDGGKFRYERSWNDSIGRVRDVLDNQGFSREINGEQVDLAPEDQQRYANSVNSVAYFALLPKPLSDPAVNATYLGLDTVKAEPYHKVKVTFDQQGGGVDHEDIFVYWFHQDTYAMDYLAYKFYTDGGGTRFREAYNTREVNGIRFADYVNYTDTVHNFALEEYDAQFLNGQVQELSRIDLENVEVQPIEDAAIADAE